MEMKITMQISNGLKDRLVQQLKIQNQNVFAQEKFWEVFEKMTGAVCFDFILNKLDDSEARRFVNLMEQDETGAKAIEFAKLKIGDLEKQLVNLMQEKIQKLSS